MIQPKRDFQIGRLLHGTFGEYFGRVIYDGI